MSRLTPHARGVLSSSEFIFPEKRAYPIPNKAHARLALADGAKDATPSQDATIKRAVHKKFPGIKQGESK